LVETSKRRRLLKKRVLVATFGLGNWSVDLDKSRMWKARLFCNLSGNDSDSDERIADVVLCSSATPTRLPVYHGSIDGSGVA
jgi:patatin-like phospholipase/acyl hydrolase